MPVEAAEFYGGTCCFSSRGFGLKPPQVSILYLPSLAPLPSATAASGHGNRAVPLDAAVRDYDGPDAARPMAKARLRRAERLEPPVARGRKRDHPFIERRAITSFSWKAGA